jgi:hypothetical protein
MAYEHDRDLVLASMAKAKSTKSSHTPKRVRQLAREAVRKTLGQSDEATEDRLRKAFAKRKEGLLEIIRIHDFVPESFERQALYVIAKILRRHGVKIIVKGEEFDTANKPNTD